MFVITKMTMENSKNLYFLTMLGNQFMSNINIYAMLECLYLCEKPPSLLRHEMGITHNITIK